MECRILYNLDGTVAVVYPAPKARRAAETRQEWLARCFTKANPDNLSFKDVDTSALPTSRFRNQWVQTPAGTAPDLVKSRGQVMLELRRVRDVELTKTDGLMAKENEIGDVEKIQAMKNYRKSLRDLPQGITAKLDAIATVEALEQEYPKDMTIENFLAK